MCAAFASGDVLLLPGMFVEGGGGGGGGGVPAIVAAVAADKVEEEVEEEVNMPGMGGAGGGPEILEDMLPPALVVVGMGGAGGGPGILEDMFPPPAVGMSGAGGIPTPPVTPPPADTAIVGVESAYFKLPSVDFGDGATFGIDPNDLSAPRPAPAGGGGGGGGGGIPPVVVDTAVPSCSTVADELDLTWDLLMVVVVVVAVSVPTTTGSDAPTFIFRRAIASASESPWDGAVDGAFVGLAGVGDCAVALTVLPAVVIIGGGGGAGGAGTPLLVPAADG